MFVDDFEEVTNIPHLFVDKAVQDGHEQTLRIHTKLQEPACKPYILAKTSQ